MLVSATYKTSLPWQSVRAGYKTRVVGMHSVSVSHIEMKRRSPITPLKLFWYCCNLDFKHGLVLLLSSVQRKCSPLKIFRLHCSNHNMILNSAHSAHLNKNRRDGKAIELKKNLLTSEKGLIVYQIKIYSFKDPFIPYNRYKYSSTVVTNSLLIMYFKIK
jgi:hypothetical protein